MWRWLDPARLGESLGQILTAGRGRLIQSNDSNHFGSILLSIDSATVMTLAIPGYHLLPEFQ